MTTSRAPAGLPEPLQKAQARSGIRQQLRDATHAIHVRLDHHPLLAGITKPGYALASYQQVLLGYFHLYRMLEDCILQAGQRQPTGMDYQARLKLPWIQADLAFFGLDPLAQAHTPRHGMAALVLSNAAQLAGTLYAIEGSTLGGQVISRHVEKNLGLTQAAGARFFNGYGAATAERWAAFEGFLQRTCVGPVSQGQACSAAVTTFLLVERILNEYQDPRSVPA